MLCAFLERGSGGPGGKADVVATSLESVTPGTRPAGTRRFHALDGLRAAMMLLGLVLHSAMPYERRGAAGLARNRLTVWLASYHCGVRNTLVGKILNGRRYPRTLPAPLREETV